jgi:hypothetical protein
LSRIVERTNCIKDMSLESSGTDIFDPEVGGDPEPTAGDEALDFLRWRT